MNGKLGLAGSCLSINFVDASWEEAASKEVVQDFAPSREPRVLLAGEFEAGHDLKAELLLGGVFRLSPVIFLYLLLVVMVLSIPLLFNCKDAFDLGSRCLKYHVLSATLFLGLVELTFGFDALEKVRREQRTLFGHGGLSLSRFLLLLE